MVVEVEVEEEDRRREIIAKDQEAVGAALLEMIKLMLLADYCTWSFI